MPGQGNINRTAPKKTRVPSEQLLLYERLVESVIGSPPKVNFGSAYTAVDGNMYSMISKYGVVGIRLPEPEHAAFLQKYETTVFRADPSWPPAKEYVTVPDQLLRQTGALQPYLKRSHEYALTLRPKVTRR